MQTYGKGGLNLQNPIIDATTKTLYAASSLAGDILYSNLESDTLDFKVLLNTGGAPSSIAIYSKQGHIFVGDLVHQAICRSFIKKTTKYIYYY
jgi:hypothetical protein